MNTYPMKFRCELCAKEFVTSSLRAFSATMRRHRDKAHPTHKGKIRYRRDMKFNNF